MTRNIYKTIVSLRFREIIFFAFLILIVLLVALYVYFIKSAIFASAERQNAEKEISQITSEISELELKYINDSKEITRDRALEMGFRDSGSVIFVKRDEGSQFSLND